MIWFLLERDSNVCGFAGCQKELYYYDIEKNIE